MAEHMMADMCTPGNPRELTVDSAREILRDCMFDANALHAGAASRALHGGNGAVPRAEAEADRSSEVSAGG